MRRIRIQPDAHAGRAAGRAGSRCLSLLLLVLLLVAVPCLPSSAEETAEAESSAAEQSAQAYLDEVTSRHMVFIGDSRTVGLYIAGVGGSATTQVLRTDANGDYWAARNGQGYDWVVSTGLPNAEKHIGDDTDVVFLTGVNDSYDLSYARKTAQLVSRKAAQYRELGARTFYVSVLPMRRNETYFTNEKISSWNAYMLENLTEDVYYIDLATASYGALSYTDDFHFQYATYRMLYQYLRLVTQYTAAVEGG